MTEKFEANLIEGPIGARLFRMTVPMIWGALALMAYNIADAFFVAKLGVLPLAAMGFIFPIVITIAHVSLGLGVGAASVISRVIGEGDHHQVQRLTTHSIYLALIVVGTVLIIGYFTIDPLFRALGASEETLVYIRQYMQIWYSGIIFLVFPMLGNHAIRASGDTLIPGLIMAFGSLSNIILDPIMIFGYFGFPAMGVRGAALATVTARALTFLLALWVLYFKKRMLAFERFSLKQLMNSWKSILHVGLPSSGTMMMPTICIAVLTWMVSDFGQEAVAGFGVAGRVEGLALVIFMALSVIFGPFVGQNWGARKVSRIRKGFTKVVNFSLIFGLFQAVVLFFLAGKIAMLFNQDPRVVKVTALYLKIVPLSYGFVGVAYMASSAFNALGKPMPAVYLMLIRLLVLHIPMAFLGKLLFGLKGLLVVANIAAIGTVAVAVVWLRKTLK